MVERPFRVCPAVSTPLELIVHFWSGSTGIADWGAIARTSARESHLTIPICTRGRTPTRS